MRHCANGLLILCIHLCNTGKTDWLQWTYDTSPGDLYVEH